MRWAAPGQSGRRRACLGRRRRAGCRCRAQYPRHWEGQRPGPVRTVTMMVDMGQGTSAKAEDVMKQFVISLSPVSVIVQGFAIRPSPYTFFPSFLPSPHHRHFPSLHRRQRRQRPRIPPTLRLSAPAMPPSTPAELQERLTAAKKEADSLKEKIKAQRESLADTTRTLSSSASSVHRCSLPVHSVPSGPIRNLDSPSRCCRC